MRVIETIAEFREARAEYGRLGFVPTMGALHAGHLSLVALAREQCEAVAVSIFVNPTQFGPNEDFQRYPRTLAADLALLEQAGVDLVFTPSVDELYPAGFATSIDVGPVTERLEGAIRPGHFAGVATVVCKLLNISGADAAFFGQKDVQQTLVIRKLVRDLNMRCRIVIGPTMREADGLALSSRNIYLDAEQRRQAPALYRALEQARACHDAGDRDAVALRRTIIEGIERDSAGVIDYVSIADPVTLAELDRIGPEGAIVSLAVRFGSTRLLDNILLGPIASAS
ncbi:pantoate--beta-alanine ligase [Sphingomonas oleivorans]|uniref:Pantothenate synthetase n=1 Tax=Sphingomonas oleivorans TaxID=1735121 RepID=A0A2T5FUZ2_9SPHN|nr:pantoate--beta-alanine ligase [Sphingomonas oleivorans]PTQ08546.1 pantoate--beta-alanine ligase [Sphingomonas oleivorans]